MEKKKKSSWWMEPFYLITLVIACCRFVVDFIVVGFKSLKNDIDNKSDEETTKKDEKMRYQELRKTLDSDEAKQAWRRYLITGLCIQGFLLLQIILQTFSANIYMVVVLCTILPIVVILFGYRSWILMTHRYNSFGVYLKHLPSNYKCVFLWNAFNALD